MKIIGLDGREYNLKLKDRMVYANDTRKRSELHLRCRLILNNMFPLGIICEEVTIPGSSGMKLDFFIPELKLAIECHGEQHYKFVPHFHGTMMGFLNSRRRDMDKKDWCENNNIVLVELKYDESDAVWTNRISSCWKD